MRQELWLVYRVQLFFLRLGLRHDKTWQSLNTVADTVFSTGLYRKKNGPSQDHTDPDITQSKHEVEASHGPVHPVHQRGT